MTTVERKGIELEQVVSRDPEVHSGDLVFAGTRVPANTLVVYLTGGVVDRRIPGLFPNG